MFTTGAILFGIVIASIAWLVQDRMIEIVSHFPALLLRIFRAKARPFSHSRRLEPRKGKCFE